MLIDATGASSLAPSMFVLLKSTSESQQINLSISSQHACVCVCMHVHVFSRDSPVRLCA